MTDSSRAGLDRRTLLKVAGMATAAAAVITQVPKSAQAHDLYPGDPIYRFDEYEAIVNRAVWFRQVYEWPNINNPIIFANVRNGMTGYQFSYGGDPDYIQVVVQAYGSANAAMYDDYIWDKYSWGQALNIKDPSTGLPATRNIWYRSNVPSPEYWPTERADPFYADISIEGLQNRGVLFLI